MNRVSLFRNTATVGTAAAALILAATPSLAGTDVRVSSYVCAHVACAYEAAEAFFISDGDDWKVCDRYADGERAKMSITFVNGNGSTETDYLEATGGAGSCVKGGVGTNIPEGHKVTVKVWHQNGAQGTPQDVATAYGTA
ncbi:hypothetical protein [Streptomyces sp. NPDC017435]|uniref:hypothetical protein n=1 Tax=Streptomyces sp. NPDC017435 TaxID=3364995 RepID=UPI00379EF8A1